MFGAHALRTHRTPAPASAAPPQPAARRLGKSTSRGLALAGLALVVVIAARYAEGYLAVVRVAENWAYDARIATFTPPAPQAADIAVVTITSETLAGLPYRSPIDRGVLSDVLLALRDKGARAIGLDVLFTQPTEPAKDERLRAVLRGLDIPVVVASAGAGSGLESWQVEFMERYLDGVTTGPAVAYKDVTDGVVRSVLLRRGDELGFAAALARETGARLPAGDELALAFRGLPHRGAPAFAQYPAHAIDDMPDSWFRGKTIIVGADLSLTDRHRTPMSTAASSAAPHMPGAFIHAHALSQIVEGREPPAIGEAPETAILLLAAATGVVLATVAGSLTMIAAASAAVVAAGWMGAFAAYWFAGAMVPLVLPTLVFLAAGGLAFGFRWRGERDQRRFIHQAFSRYVSPAVVERLIEDPGLLKLGGERRDTTFLFTDVTDYVTLSERTDAESLLRLMNEYLDGLLRIVLEHDGTIDKIVGDGIAVMFNAPVPQPDHPERAVRCALALDRYCRAFAARQARLGVDFGRTRIGVHTGEAVVGNYGGMAHYEYSATGDSINVAARLESVNKHLGTTVCVSGDTARRCSGIEFRPVASLVLKGRSSPTEAFEPIGSGRFGRAGAVAYCEAYRLLATGAARAAPAFESLAACRPDDGLARFHASRLAAGQSGERVVMMEK